MNLTSTLLFTALIVTISIIIYLLHSMKKKQELFDKKLEEISSSSSNDKQRPSYAEVEESRRKGYGETLFDEVARGKYSFRAKYPDHKFLYPYEIVFTDEWMYSVFVRRLDWIEMNANASIEMLDEHTAEDNVKLFSILRFVKSHSDGKIQFVLEDPYGKITTEPFKNYVGANRKDDLYDRIGEGVFIHGSYSDKKLSVKRFQFFKDSF